MSDSESQNNQTNPNFKQSMQDTKQKTESGF
jgi:hypothetical protein